MDLRLTPGDRVTGPGRSKKATRKPAAGKKSRSKTSAKKPAARRRSRSPKTGTSGFSFWRLIGRVCYWGTIAAVWMGIGFAGLVIYYGLQLPSSNSWAVPDRPANIRIVAADGQLISNRGQMGGEAVALRELPHYVGAAIVAIEDRRFRSHFGLDPLGILGAMRINVMEGRQPLNGNGGSTITQQVAKNLFLTPEQTIGRKLQEALLAIWLEQEFSKEQILELYLNRVYFGAGAYGIEAAAQRYFGKSARNLSLGEAAILAGVLQAPSRLSPDRHPEAAAARARLVLGAMAEEEFISAAEAEAAAIDPNKRIRTRIAGAEYYVADWVETLMSAYVGVVGEDLIVSTTIDWDLQKQAEFVIRESIREHGEEGQFSQGALVAMDVDGSVRAIVGGIDYQASQFNRAVTAQRQSGSAFKPIVYLAAMEKGYTPETVADDAPFTYQGWSPENASGRYAGRVTLREALANSLNTVAARLAIDVGPDKIVETANRLGISSPLMAVPSIALGTQEVSLLELTAAYAPIANGGAGIVAHVITRVETADGRVLYQNSAAGPGQVIGQNEVAMMNDMLSGALETGTGRRASLPGWPIAGKTGTSQNNRDALFVGYSARLVAGIWLGNDDGSPMAGVGGGSYPADIWSDFMQFAHRGLVVADLPGAYQGAVEPLTAAAPAEEKPKTIMDLLGGLFGG